MTSEHPNGRVDPEPDARRLSSAWDDLVEGHPVEVGGPGDELVRLARRLHVNTPTVRERPGYRTHLRDTIMHAPTTALPFPRLGTDSPTREAGGALVPLSLPTSLRRAGVRWLSLAATVALLLATAAGGYLASSGLPGDRAPATSVGALQEATPGPAVAPGPLIGQLDPYTPLGGSLPTIVARTGIAGDFPEAALAVSDVQMQRWQIDGGQTATFTAPVAPLVGVGMDVVINGAYSATFSAPVTVTDNQSDIRYLYDYPSANTPVELVTGDVVIYELGTKDEVTNPLASELLQFKTVLFHEGDPSPDNLGAGGDFGVTVDGDGALPEPIDAYGSGLNITLTYSQLLPGYPFPPEPLPDSPDLTVVLGPVDPVGGPVGTEGFILWASAGRG